jgi:putative DNA primase/helicase
MADLRITPGNEVRLRRVKFLDTPGMIPIRSLTVLFGPAGLGKTTYSMSLAAAVSRGTMPGFPTPRNVLISSHEDDLDDTLAPRAVAAGADLSRLSFVSGLTLPAGVEDLHSKAKALEAGLLIIDPITSHLDAGIDSHKNAAIRGALAPIVELAADLELAVVAVAHPNKGGGGAGLTRLSGSGAFGEAPRSVIVFGANPSSEEGSSDRVIAHLKSNKGPTATSLTAKIETVEIETEDGPADATRLAVTGTTDVRPEAILEVQRPGEIGPKAFLDEFLGDDPVPVRELQAEADNAGVSWRSIEKVKKDAGIRSVKEGNAWYWQAPKKEAA